MNVTAVSKPSFELDLIVLLTLYLTLLAIVYSLLKWYTSLFVIVANAACLPRKNEISIPKNVAQLLTADLDAAPPPPKKAKPTVDEGKVGEPRGFVVRKTPLSRLPSKKTSERQYSGKMRIANCEPEGKFIVVENCGRIQAQNISSWQLHRNIDHMKCLMFKFPEQFVLKPRGSCRVWANSDEAKEACASQESTKKNLLNGEITSWQVGSVVETTLLDNEGQVVAKFSETNESGGTQ